MSDSRLLQQVRNWYKNGRVGASSSDLCVSYLLEKNMLSSRPFDEYDLSRCANLLQYVPEIDFDRLKQLVEKWSGDESGYWKILLADHDRESFIKRYAMSSMIADPQDNIQERDLNLLDTARTNSFDHNELYCLVVTCLTMSAFTIGYACSQINEDDVAKFLEKFDIKGYLPDLMSIDSITNTPNMSRNANEWSRVFDMISSV